MKCFRMYLIAAVCAGSLVSSMLLTGCSSIAQGVAAVGQATGVVSPQQAQSIVRTASAVGKTFQDITPEQEYYIGRAVGATIVNQYQVYDNRDANAYINLVGQTLARFSDKPETFKGYRFLILDSDEINAFAAPGGFIFISRGMLRLCTSEDELAAVLAHEIGHVQNQHALKAIKSSRVTSALTILAAEGAKNFGGQQLADLTSQFEGSISDITSKLMNSGYARGQERDADQAAVTILERVGYDPNALIRVLDRMEGELEPGGHDFAATHPPPESRIKDLQAMIETPPRATVPARQARFNGSMSGV